MNWAELTHAMYEDTAACVGDAVLITSSDDSESVTVMGLYDRRILVGEAGGTEYQVPDYKVGVPANALPGWAGAGCVLEVRGDKLFVTDVQPDGQGLIYLVCRPDAD